MSLVPPRHGRIAEKGGARFIKIVASSSRPGWVGWQSFNVEKDASTLNWGGKVRDRYGWVGLEVESSDGIFVGVIAGSPSSAKQQSRLELQRHASGSFGG